MCVCVGVRERVCCAAAALLQVLHNVASGGGGEDLPCGSFRSLSFSFSPSPCEFPLPLCVRAIVVVRERARGCWGAGVISRPFVEQLKRF